MKKSSQQLRPLPKAVFIPGRDHLERGVFSLIRVRDRDVFFCGNGPNLAIMQVVDDCNVEFPFKAPFVEIRVFPVAPQTVRGIVDMFCDGYLIAYSEKYFAVIADQQLHLGGTLCISRIVSTGGFIVGGRRTVENTVQFCFENGAVEEYFISQGNGKMSINRISSLKFGLSVQRKITAVLFGDTDLLGMSDGAIFRLSGAVILRKRVELNSAIIQMTLMSNNLLLALFGSGTIALIDLNRCSLLSTIKGRFTAIQQMMPRTTFIAGDLDGSVHSINIEEGQLIYRMTLKERFRGRICQLFNLRRTHIVVGTDTGGLRVLSSQPFLPQLQHGVLRHEFTMNCAQFALTRAGWVSIENDRVKIRPYLNSPSHKYLVGNNFSERGVRMKYHYGVDRETVCCYGKNTLCFITTDDPSGVSARTDSFKCELKNHFNANARIVSLILQEEYIFVQCDDNYQAAFNLDFHKRAIAKTFAFTASSSFTTLTSATILENGAEIFFIAGYKDGSVAGFSGYLGTGPLKLKPIMVDVRNSYVVSSLPRCDSIFLLTAKGMCFEVWEPSLTDGEYHSWNKAFETIAVKREWSLGGIIGNGRSLSHAGEDVVVSGFKGNMLNLYNVLKDDHIGSVETAGPRRPFQIMLSLWSTQCTLALVHTLPHVLHPVIRAIPLPNTVPYADLRHSAPINVMHYLKNNGDPTTYFISGDSSGVLLYSKFTQVTTHSVELISDFQLDGAIICTAFERKVLYVSTSNSLIYKFERFFEEMLLTPTKVIRIASPAESMVVRVLTDIELVCLCRDGVLRLLHNNGFVSDSVHFTPGRQKGSEVVELNKKLRVFYSLRRDFVLQRTHPYRCKPSNERLTLKGVPLSSFYMRGGAFEGSIDEILAGTPDGWLYLMWFSRKENKYIFVMADRYHTHPIIEIRWYCIMHNEGRYNVVSMDASGFVVVREFKVSSTRPYLTLACPVRKWQSPVNSPRTMEVFPDRGEMFVCGKGASWYYLLEESRN